MQPPPRTPAVNVREQTGRDKRVLPATAWIFPVQLELVGGFLPASLVIPVFGKLDGHRSDRTFPLPAPQYPTGGTLLPQHSGNLPILPLIPVAPAAVWRVDF